MCFVFCTRLWFFIFIRGLESKKYAKVDRSEEIFLFSLWPKNVKVVDEFSFFFFSFLISWEDHRLLRLERMRLADSLYKQLV